MKNFLKRHRELTITFLVIFTCGFLGISMAYLIEINNDGIVYSTKGKAKSSNPNITFTAENTSLSIKNAYPVSDIVGLASTPYTFSIQNNESKYNVKYEIYLETKDGTSGYLSDNLVKYALKDNASSGILLSNLTYSTASLSTEGYTKSYLIATGEVANTRFLKDDTPESVSYDNYILNEETLDITKNYSMRLWIDESATVESASGKSWTGKLVVKYSYEIPDPDQSTYVDPDIIPGYTEVKYLQFSGTQYIDTQKVPSSNSAFYLEMEPTGGATGASNGSSGKTIFDFRNSTVSLFWNGDTGTKSAPKGKYTYYIDYYRKKVGYDNTYETVTDPSTGYSTVHFVIGAWLEGTTYYYKMSGKLYDFNYYLSGISNMHLVPCISNSNSKPGLCDTVSNTFYSNQGTGEFGYETLEGVVVNPT